MRKKRLIIALALATLPLIECLADNVRILMVNAKDGTNTMFVLADEPKITCKGGEFTIVSSSRTLTLSLANVQNYTFSEVSTNISEVMKEKCVKLENGYVLFNGLTAGSNVSVYMQDGRLVKERKADVNGTAIIDLSNLPKGVVILHSNKTGIKIINR